MSILSKIFGTKSDREIKKILPLVKKINDFYNSIENYTEKDLQNRTREIKEEISQKIISSTDEKEVLDSYIIETFAMVKHACRLLVGKEWEVVGQVIKWEMIPYDEQIIGGVVLHQGKIAEMKTGEGKTLVATFPIYLNALTGNGVHVITVNDYLAKRDAQWMGRVFETLGLNVGFIINSMNPSERKISYSSDITYGTNNEFGFDYLRDNMSVDSEHLVQRKHNFAIVDEVDSVLIDEARTPLIISGPVESQIDQSYIELRPSVQSLVRRQESLVNDLLNEAKSLLKKEEKSNEDKFQIGLLLLKAKKGLPKNESLQLLFQTPGNLKLMNSVESQFIAEKKVHELDEDLLFVIDEQANSVDLSDKGREFLSPNSPESFTIPNLGEILSEIDEMHIDENDKLLKKEEAYSLHSNRSSRIHHLQQLLKAFTLFQKDVEYVVQNGQVLIVDEFTGRVLPGRRFSGGLHQALESKENVKIENETQTLASITLQNYFRMYNKLAGMTGTAETEAAEFEKIYKLEVTVIPTHKPVARKDFDDVIYKSMQAKYQAVINEVISYYKSGQPVLIGTVSVDVSELLSKMLKKNSIPHNVLNAKQHQREAEIVAQAGLKKSVTIATNMAGRGTDIKLGPGVEEIGGLHIIGTARHESRRIDLQLMGRAGRQGDKGSSRFYISLEDDLMRLFNMDKLATYMDRLSIDENQELSAGMLNRGVRNAQQKVEERNFAIRKHLLEYDDVLNQHRTIIYELRNKALKEDSIKPTFDEFIEDYLLDVFYKYEDIKAEELEWNDIKNRLKTNLMLEIDEKEFRSISNIDTIVNKCLSMALDNYSQKEAIIPEEILRKVEKFIFLKTIDEKWRNHLQAMDQLREGIGLRAYGQKNPLIEYKSESFILFQELLSSLKASIVQRIFHAQINAENQSQVTSPKRVKLSQSENFINQSQSNEDLNDTSDNKIGRNSKIIVISPSGEKKEIKYKKLDVYLSQGYKRV
ncbi:MAG: preprotein translocase subunit SecA [Pelagibacteraceae bacterium]